MSTLDAPPDDQLWSRARRGDPAAFGELFTRHSTVVYNYCFRLTGSWKTAEDLTSVVFLEAWRRREDVTVEAGAFVPWLLGLASKVARNSTRAVRRHRRLLAKLPPAVIEGRAGDDDQPSTARDGAGPDAPDPADPDHPDGVDHAHGVGEAPDTADSERRMKQILRVFRRLPKQEQEVLALCVWGERTYAEAAVALGIPVGTVRSRLARARAHMERMTEAAAAKSRGTQTPPGTRTEGAHHR
ncbi:RNA polymerase sigma factor [Jiangella asiatica]|uniref:Sigma-70 family RNA polymerase sigma factor n=1 Tax=Jiangella asiatica TaxID=2530372 RepID=A0A4R5DB65_9ACTN|nr:sigma-70 family RNA polymerase sigma factor [Jiangella asiatica]TDE08734.1 sigma-70 family RNA polymerase sigma factor [Jiangella asiatica]